MKTLTLAAALAILAARPGSGQQAADDKPAPPEYAGSEMCQGCHEDIFLSFQKTAHRAISARKEWADRSCESCHGPGSRHAESLAPADIRNPARLDAAQADAACLACHKNKPSQTGRLRGGHARNQASCISCHAVHEQAHKASVTNRLVTREARAVNQQCGTCHISARSSFERPHAHRLSQGAMKCTGCHNPHGSPLSAPIRAVSANEPGCLRCHGDKRGPFTFEHAPVRLEGCESCHEPHGSANPRMLKRHEVSLLCLECHSNVGTTGTRLGGTPPAFHDLRSARFRNCTVCHVKVHGSHVSRALLR